MTDSDSDAFESADEEVEVKKQQKKGKKSFELTKAANKFFAIFREILGVIHDAGHKKKAEEPAKVVKPEQTTPESQTPVEAQPEPKEEAPAAPSSWRSWGAFTAILNASKHVASITTQVSQSIIDSINIPDPEEMARLQAKKRRSWQNLMADQ